MNNLEHTQFFKVGQEQKLGVEEIFEQVYEALAEKGYNPVNQIVGVLDFVIGAQNVVDFQRTFFILQDVYALWTKDWIIMYFCRR